MENKFKFPVLKRLSPLVLSPPCVLLAYGFVSEAIQIGSILGMVVCIIVSFFFISIPIVLANHSLTVVITNERGLLIKAFFKTTFTPWEEIVEYGKSRKLVLLGGAWCYYIKRASDGKEIKIGFEYFRRMRILNNIIIKRTEGAKLCNTGYEMG